LREELASGRFGYGDAIFVVESNESKNRRKKDDESQKSLVHLLSLVPKWDYLLAYYKRLHIGRYKGPNSQSKCGFARLICGGEKSRVTPVARPNRDARIGTRRAAEIGRSYSGTSRTGKQ
jgi:hypothetical protein